MPEDPYEMPASIPKGIRYCKHLPWESLIHTSLIARPHVCLNFCTSIKKNMEGLGTRPVCAHYIHTP